MKFAHLVNPVDVSPESDLFVAQPITFEAMRRARQVAQQSGHVVTLLATGFPEDRHVIPGDFHWTGDLKRSALELAAFDVQRRLPLLRDVLKGFDAAPAETEFFIYSNVDIAPMPYFYETLASLLGQGLDGLVVNRRTISDAYQHPDQLDLMYAEVGEEHPGHDCFVFRRSALDRFDLGNVVVGVNWVGRVFIWNVAAFAGRFLELTNAHLTFHVGDDRTWTNPRMADWREHNQSEAQEALKRIVLATGLGPGSQLWRYVEDLRSS